jgi:Mn2+/Fe2+ NRAMP family transporter
MFDIYNYTNQTDLFTLAIGFVGALIGGLLSYLSTKQVYKYQLKNESKIIAKALDINPGFPPLITR